MSQLHVICRIGDSEYAIPADEVFQMETFSTATPVPGAPSYVMGLIQVRQKIIPLLNARKRFGLPDIAPDLENRVVVLKKSDRLVGLLVDSAREVQNISPEIFKVPPEIISRQSEGFVKSVANFKERIIMLLDTLKVVGEEMDHAKRN